MPQSSRLGSDTVCRAFMLAHKRKSTVELGRKLQSQYQPAPIVWPVHAWKLGDDHRLM